MEPPEFRRFETPQNGGSKNGDFLRSKTQKKWGQNFGPKMAIFCNVVLHRSGAGPGPARDPSGDPTPPGTPPHPAPPFLRQIAYSVLAKGLRGPLPIQPLLPSDPGIGVGIYNAQNDHFWVGQKIPQKSVILGTPKNRARQNHLVKSPYFEPKWLKKGVILGPPK